MDPFKTGPTGLFATALVSLGKSGRFSLGVVPTPIGVRDGGAGGAAAPPIRAVCRHEFGQRVDIIRAKPNKCLNNTNLGSVTAVNEKNT